MTRREDEGGGDPSGVRALGVPFPKAMGVVCLARAVCGLRGARGAFDVPKVKLRENLRDVFVLSDDETYMRRALELAARGTGWTSPNPMVGCVVTRDGAIVGEGYHAKAGGPHAEVEALRGAGDVSSATVYVTLEPCAHTGKTPPCVDLLREKRPARIVAAMLDPNPDVDGGGVAALRAAGITVDVGLLEDEARRLNEAFIKHVTTGLPFVIAKCGMSLDGKIATADGDSKWITGEAARARVHELRHEVDAILVGYRTVLADRPRLTSRIADRETRDPVRVVVDTRGAFDSETDLFHEESSAPTWIATPNGDAEDAIAIVGVDDAQDMATIMSELGKRGVTSVVIEGGGATLGAAFSAGVVDKVMFFVGAKILGGRDAVPAVGGRGVTKVDEAIRLRDMHATPLGKDILIEAYVAGDVRGGD